MIYKNIRIIDADKFTDNGIKIIEAAIDILQAEHYSLYEVIGSMKLDFNADIVYTTSLHEDAGKWLLLDEKLLNKIPNTYYADQLDKIQPAVSDEYGISVKFTSSKAGDTNYMKLNDESASAIVEFLSNNYTLTLK